MLQRKNRLKISFVVSLVFHTSRKGTIEADRSLGYVLIEEILAVPRKIFYSNVLFYGYELKHLKVSMGFLNEFNSKQVCVISNTRIWKQKEVNESSFLLKIF